ncbi:MAG: DUF3857 domain-containing protein [Bacteroidales bacterium]
MKKTIILSIITGLIIIFSSCDKKDKDYSDSDAVYNKIVKTYTLNEDGSLDYRYQHELDIHSYYAFNRMYGESFIVYNPDHQEVTINKSETTMADGKKVPSPDNAYNEVLPGMASGAPPYSHLREMVVTHTGLEKNSTINFDYEVKSDKDFIPFLMENEVLAQTSPVKELIIKVEVPENVTLNHKLLNAKENLNIAEKGETKEYTWKFRHIEPLSDENHQPEFNNHVPRLIFSTQNLNETYEYLSEKISYDLPAGIEERVNGILENSQSMMDSIRSIQKMVVNHINHFDIPLKYKGYNLNNNQKVLEDNGGTTEEKTILLASLLKNIGVQARPVAVVPEEYFSENTGNLNTTEKYYVKVTQDDEDIFLSAIEDNKINHLYKYADSKNLLLDDQEPKFIDTEDQETSKANFKGEFTLNKDLKMEGNMNVTFTHCENPYLMLKDNNDAVKSLLTPFISDQDIQNVEINKITPKESAIDYTIETKVSQEKQGNYNFMKIPDFSVLSDVVKMQQLVSKRTAPLQINHPVEINYSFKINKPEGLDLRTKNISKNIENELGELYIDISQSEDIVTIDKKLLIKNDYIEGKNYQHFLELISQWQKDSSKELVFKDIED